MKLFLLLLGGVVITVGAVGLALAAPLVLVGGAVTAIAIALLTKPFGRLAVYTFGILLIFQSAALGTEVRLVFVAVIVVGLAPALLSIQRRATASGLRLRGFITPVVLLFALLPLGLPLLSSTPVSIDDWLRDASTYLLIAAGPVYGIDGALSATRKHFETLTIVVGVVGAAAYMVAWLSRRGYAIGGLSQFALANGTIVIPSIILCLIFFYRKGNLRFVWAALAVVQAAMLLASGGRSTALILAGILGVMFVVGPRLGGGIRRNVAVVVAAGGGFYAATLITDATVRVGYLVERLGFFGDASLEALQEDGSGILRLRAYDTAWNTFAANPLFGTGFGYNYPSVQSDIVVKGIYTLDSPTIILAKLGIIGTGVLLAALAMLFVRAVKLSEKGRPARREITILLFTTAIALAAVLPSGPVTEQKGLGICLALVIGLSVVWARDAVLRAQTEAVEPSRVQRNAVSDTFS